MNLPHLKAQAVPVPVSPKRACGGAKRGRKPYSGPPREAVTVLLPITLVDEIRSESRRRGVNFITFVTAILVAAMSETRN